MKRTNSFKRTIGILLFSTVPYISAGQAPDKFPENIKPLITTRWGQHFPYNIYAPQTTRNGETTQDPAGCGPTAMAQVINYHQYPQHVPAIGHTYDWTLMFDKYKTNLDRKEWESVAQLVQDCGISSFTWYSRKGSSSSLSAIMGSMKHHFLYSTYMSLYNREQFATPQLDSIYRHLLFSELKAGRPVIYRGHSKKKGFGHIFLIDGCKGNKVHVNMGWEGKGDGYYTLDDLNTYCNEQWMLIGVADSTYRPEVKQVCLSSAGTLGEELGDDGRLLTRHIQISGPMNDQDFATLREMLNNGLLRTINLKQAQVSALPDSAFSACPYLSDMILPHTLERIGHHAFSGCINLNRIELPQGLEVIGNGAFGGCIYLREIELPPNLKSILNNAFNSCQMLTYVNIPKSVKILGNYVFAHCKRLQTLLLPESITSIGKDITHDCPLLKHFTPHT